jgi:uncharacterized membrane protein YedE/YeeE
MIALLVPFAIGVVMAVGFALAGVTRPETIVGFLDFFGDWQPDVMLVMGAAVAVTAIAYRFAWSKPRPLLGGRFALPTRRDIDSRLVVGAALFGLGWGLVGLCPGPALASLAAGSWELGVWLASVVGGMLAFRAFESVARARRLGDPRTVAVKDARRPAEARPDEPVVDPTQSHVAA